MAQYPITFIGLDGQPTDDRIVGAPCISIGFFYNAPSDGSPKAISRYWALLDTGADQNYADPTVLDAVNAPVIGSAGRVNGEGSALIHEASAVLENPQIIATSLFVSRDFKREGAAPYLIVLGRLFLQIGNLNFDLRDPENGCYFDCDLNVFRPEGAVPA